MLNTIVRRIEVATGIVISTSADQHKLSGIFSRYRPEGAGLECLFEASGVEGEILFRLKKIFLATASSWKPGDLYFTIRQFESIDRATAATIVEDYLAGFKRFAEHVGDVDIASALDGARVEFDNPIGACEDERLATMMYECLTDFLAAQQTSRCELFFLKEALFSMACDYFLMAYVIWPALEFRSGLSHVLDSYFDVWRYGIGIKFVKGRGVIVNFPGQLGASS